MYNKSTEGYGRRTMDGCVAIKCKGLPHTPRGQSRGDRYYIENKICAIKTVTGVCKKKIPSLRSL
jgi:hypothetical protein